MKTGTKLCGTLAIALGCVAAAPAAAQPLSSDDSLKELSAQWWQWTLSIPPGTTHPAFDTTGQFCMVGQRGPVWFLAGTFAPAQTVRACSVPEGVDLFFPVVNQSFYNSPGCGQVGDFSAKDMRAVIAPVIESATNLAVKLDNAPVTNLRRVRSVVYPTALADGWGCPVTVYSPSVDDGIYVRLQGLSVGQHALSIQGSVIGLDGNPFSVDVFYNLTVVKVSTK